ncbi:MAG TPA: 5-(carboxyamino)imidazole ribonucleotide synthase, partial [Microthrixaceae bacterium]|nr:5-(carboxyamino)imidazole ribonucleotide synthase [Microthrixaceae bacterium]
EPVVGVIGGGQLARMLAEAASPLGVHLRVLASPSDEGAAAVVADTVLGDHSDAATLDAFADSVDVITFDHENVDHGLLSALEARGVAVRPSVATLLYSDKAHQRRRFAEAGIPVPEFLVLDPTGDPDRPAGAATCAADAVAFAERHGGVAVVKASRGGYDGRGVWMLPASDIGAFVETWTGAPLVLEPRLELSLELAVLAARTPSGEVATWPLLETVQVDGMCDEVLLPAAVPAELEVRARALGARVAEEVGAQGVIAVELFVVSGSDEPDDAHGADATGPRLFVNEIAPRVHNSGHLTIEASATSQFEQHLRAVLDWPLGPTHSVSPGAVMANVVGTDAQEPRRRQARALAEVPGAHVH